MTESTNRYLVHLLGWTDKEIKLISNELEKININWTMEYAK